VSEIIQYVWVFIAVVFFFSLAIGVHEWGHFLAARWQGLKVDRFAIGFGPPLMSWRWNGVEYCICSIPLGGYVALPQMAPMEMIEGENKTKTKDLPPVSAEAKIITAFFGPLFSFLLALVLAAIVWQVGVPRLELETQKVIGYVDPTRVETAKILQAGDEVLEVDGAKVTGFMDIYINVVLGSNDTIAMKIKRDGNIMDVALVPEKKEKGEMRRLGIAPAQKVFVERVGKRSPGAAGGVQKGDEILEVNSLRVLSPEACADIIQKSKDVPITLKVLRNGQEKMLDVTPRLMADTKGLDKDMPDGWAGIGIQFQTPEYKLAYPTISRQFTRIWFQTKKTWIALFSSKSDVKLKDMSGAVGIVDTYSRLLGINGDVSFGIKAALAFSVLLNFSLAIMNLLPLPVLDGGHIMLSLIEKIRGKAIGYKLLNHVQNVFIVIILAFMVYVNFHDVKRVFSRKQEEASQKKPLDLDERTYENFTFPASLGTNSTATQLTTKNQPTVTVPNGSTPKDEKLNIKTPSPATPASR